MYVLFMCKRKMQCRIACDGKWTVGGCIRECVRLTEYSTFRSGMEEKLEGNGKDGFISNTEVEAELGKADDSIAYQITVLVRVR